jgi:beta-glucosidase
MEQKPLYPFGFGLSYTNYRFDSLELSANTIAPDGSINAKVTLTNTGKRDGEEVVQLYVSKDKRNADDPVTSLRSFRRVAIPAGKQVSVELKLPAAAFESVNAEGKSVLVPGSYTVTAADAAPLAISVERGAPKPVYAKVEVKG